MQIELKCRKGKTPHTVLHQAGAVHLALRGSDSEFPHLKAGSGHVTHLLGNGEPEEKNPST